MAFTDLERRMRSKHPPPAPRRTPVQLVGRLLLGLGCLGYGIVALCRLPDHGSVWSGIAPYLVILAGSAWVWEAVIGFMRLRSKPLPGVPDADSIEVPRARARRR